MPVCLPPRGPGFSPAAHFVLSYPSFAAASVFFRVLSRRSDANRDADMISSSRTAGVFHALTWCWVVNVVCCCFFYLFESFPETPSLQFSALWDVSSSPAVHCFKHNLTFSFRRASSTSRLSLLCATGGQGKCHVCWSISLTAIIHRDTEALLFSLRQPWGDGLSWFAWNELMFDLQVTSGKYTCTKIS